MLGFPLREEKRGKHDNDLSQTKIASLLFIAQKTYSDYEVGGIRIPIDSLITLARFYNVSMDYISGVSDIKSEFPKA